MYQHLTKLFLAGVAALALLALGTTSILAPAWAAPPDKSTLGKLPCSTDQIAKYDGSAWVCVALPGEADVTDLQAQLDNLALLAFHRASAFVFVTSTLHTGNLGGIAGADDICNGLAIAAGLPGEYKAWLASSEEDDDPESTFARAPGPYILPDGVKVADDWADLTHFNSIYAPINVDENGTGSFSDRAWTNVDDNGTLTSADVHCDGWTRDTTDFFGGTGLTNGWQGPGWTRFEGGMACDNNYSLYCFGQ